MNKIKRKILFVTTRSPFSNILSGDRQRARTIIQHLNKKNNLDVVYSDYFAGKYAPEVKQVVQKLLEQEPGEEDPLADMGLGDEESEQSSVMDDVPAAYDPAADDEEIVVVDLDQIIAAAEDDADAGEDAVLMAFIPLAIFQLGLRNQINA